MVIVLAQGRRTSHFTVDFVEYANGELKFGMLKNISDPLAWTDIITLQPGDRARVYDYGWCLSNFKG